MKLLCTLAPALLGVMLAASPALAQTKPPTHRVARPAPRMVPNTTPAAKAANPLRGTNDNGKGQSGYAAPGEPITIKDNGKNTPPYDGPAAGRSNSGKNMTMPRKQ